MRHILKKLIGWMLCLAMAVGMLSGMTRKVKAIADSGEYFINMCKVLGDVRVYSGTGGGNTVVVTGTSPSSNLTIEAGEGEEITVLFRGENIEPSGYRPAVLVQGEGKVTIQLEESNILSGSMECAGIQKSDKVALTITSSEKGNLTATGGDYGAAGIGGGHNEEGSNITISGNAQVTATGGENGAGIGGGT